MELNQLFILNLKKWRKRAGISQKILAERCGAAHSYIRQIESGKGHPSFVFIGKLAKALNIEPYMLFYDENKPKTVSQSDQIELIKSEFINNISSDLDKFIEKMKT
jgi:transcriptional regulator with XRE-family HTH domain